MAKIQLRVTLLHEDCLVATWNDTNSYTFPHGLKTNNTRCSTGIGYSTICRYRDHISRESEVVVKR